jgi:hypothetical protein
MMSTRALQKDFLNAPMLLKLFHKIERKGMPPNSYYETYYPDTKTRQRHNNKKENHRSVFLMNLEAKILNKIPEN